MELGNELKVERVRLKLKAKELAELINISPQQVCNLEQSQELTVVAKYLAYLRSRGTDLNDLFDRVEIIKTTSL